MKNTQNTTYLGETVKAMLRREFTVTNVYIFKKGNMSHQFYFWNRVPSIIVWLIA
jgi:hypothetical protein